MPISQPYCGVAKNARGNSLFSSTAMASSVSDASEKCLVSSNDIVVYSYI